LAYKKTFPALFGLFKQGSLPPNTHIVGFARSEMEHGDYLGRISQKFKVGAGESDKKDAFLAACSYVAGHYDSGDSFIKLAQVLERLEEGYAVKNRVFYMALPPSVFLPAATNLRQHVYAAHGFTRLIVEKPFGKDYASCKALLDALGGLWLEKEIYRIDHYLGKEMVKGLLRLRFENELLRRVWDRESISSVHVVFKEMIGTEGRGGYFDEFGIIRDVIIPCI
jgi:glucose-6-phosphate 1-dehydrogenase